MVKFKVTGSDALASPKALITMPHGEPEGSLPESIIGSEVP